MTMLINTTKKVQKRRTDLGNSLNYAGSVGSQFNENIVSKNSTKKEIDKAIQVRNNQVNTAKNNKLKLIDDYELKLIKVLKRDGTYCLYFERETPRRVYTYDLKVAPYDVKDFEARSGLKIKTTED